MLFPLPSGDQITHPDLVAALAKPGDAILATLTAEKADAWHMASCIPGEAGELFQPLVSYEKDGNLDKDNLIEELGDIEFYVQGLRAIYGISYEETVTDRWKSWSDLPARAADVFDVAKRWIIYNKPIDRAAMVKALSGLEEVIGTIRWRFSITREQTLGANVMKLGERYASLSYSDAAAQQRADKQGTVH